MNYKLRIAKLRITVWGTEGTTMDDVGISVEKFVISTGVVSALSGIAGAWIRARYARTRIEPQPLEVRQSPSVALKPDNDRDHENIFSRLSEHDKAISRLQEGMRSTEDRLKSMDGKLDILIRRGK